MQTLKNEKVEVINILENYDVYDIGETPYVVSKNRVGNIEYKPGTLFDAIENRTQENPENEVRKKVLQLARKDEEGLDQLLKECSEYIVAAREEGESYKTRQTGWGNYGLYRLRFARFLMDIPKEKATSLLEKMISSKSRKADARDFLDMIKYDVNERPQQLNPIVDLIEKYLQPQK